MAIFTACGMLNVQVAFWKRVVGFTRLSLPAGDCGDGIIDVSADDIAVHKALDGARGADLALGAWPGSYIFSSERCRRGWVQLQV